MVSHFPLVLDPPTERLLWLVSTVLKWHILFWLLTFLYNRWHHPWPMFYPGSTQCIMIATGNSRSSPPTGSALTHFTMDLTPNFTITSTHSECGSNRQQRRVTGSITIAFAVRALSSNKGPSAFSTAMARNGLRTCTCFLTKCHRFWNVLVLVWISIKTECSLQTELFLPPTLVARGPLIRLRWCHPPGLTSLAEAPDAGDEAELADEPAQADTALRFQRFKSRTTFIIRRNPVFTKASLHKSFLLPLRVSALQIPAPTYVNYLSHQCDQRPHINK